MDAFKSFRKAGTVVFCRVGQRKLLPPGAKSLYSKLKIIELPSLFVTTYDAQVGIEALPCDEIEDDVRKAAREFRKRTEGMDFSGKSSSSAPGEELVIENKSELLAPNQTWKNFSGEEITAAIQSLEGDKVNFLMPSGKVVGYPIAKLSTEDQAKIGKLSKN